APSITAPAVSVAPAALSLAAPAACLPPVASAAGALAPFLATAAPPDGQPAPGDAEPTMERFIDREFVASVVGPPAGRPLQGAELETRTHEVGLLLRCPVCQGSSVADSPSSTAINMKNEVRDLLAKGYDQPQILAWFEASYGQFVLMEPKAEGLNMLVWLGPGVLLLAGLVLVGLQIRKSMRGPDDASLDEGAPAVDPELESYLRDARALAFGDAADGSASTSHGRSKGEDSPDRRSN
ncbi:MAG TPA: cytochrome c-type biogenesis protein CcmH, partial [Vulgatibacter sp.]